MRISDWSSDVCSSDLAARWALPRRSRHGHREVRMASERTERTYRLEPLDSSGIFLGLTVVQCALLGAGVALGVASLTAGVPLLIAAAPILLAAAMSFTRLAGHATWEWLPLLAGWLWTRVRRGRR